MIDWDKSIYRLGEAARPMVMTLTGVAFSVGMILPIVETDKLVAGGAVVTALFAVKGYDLRAQHRADAEVKIAAVNATETKPKGKTK